MIRQERWETSTCYICRRPGWTRRKPYSLLTSEEDKNGYFTPKEIELLKGAPTNAEVCTVHLGTTIYETVKEAKEIAEMMQKPIAFCFNDALVVVYRDSDVKDVIDKWWVKVYGKTQEESYRER